jgi:hypothetical protein
MMLNLPPERTQRYSPGGVSRYDHPELADASDEDFVQFLCEWADATDNPAARPR